MPTTIDLTQERKIDDGNDEIAKSKKNQSKIIRCLFITVIAVNILSILFCLAILRSSGFGFVWRFFIGSIAIGLIFNIPAIISFYLLRTSRIRSSLKFMLLRIIFLSIIQTIIIEGFYSFEEKMFKTQILMNNKQEFSRDRWWPKSSHIGYRENEYYAHD